MRDIQRKKTWFFWHQSFCYLNNKEDPSQNSWNKNREVLLFQNKATCSHVRTVLPVKVDCFSFLWCHWHFLWTEAVDINRELQMERRSQIDMKTVTQTDKDTHTHTDFHRESDTSTRQLANKQVFNAFKSFTCYYCNAACVSHCLCVIKKNSSNKCHQQEKDKLTSTNIL